MKKAIGHGDQVTWLSHPLVTPPQGSYLRDMQKTLLLASSHSPAQFSSFVKFLKIKPICL